jgi:hypothetical protein
MLIRRYLLPLVLLSWLVVGCSTSKVTNLTPSREMRNPNNLYLVEYQWNSLDQTIRPDTITPYVVVGFDFYPMRRTPKMTNRWEAYIPVAANQKSISYHFRVDYDYNSFGKERKGSQLSAEYKMQLGE